MHYTLHNAAGTVSTPGGVADGSECSASVEPAKFIGTAMAMGQGAGHLWATAHSLSHTWENFAAQ